MCHVISRAYLCDELRALAPPLGARARERLAPHRTIDDSSRNWYAVRPFRNAATHAGTALTTVHWNSALSSCSAAQLWKAR